MCGGDEACMCSASHAHESHVSTLCEYSRAHVAYIRLDFVHLDREREGADWATGAHCWRAAHRPCKPAGAKWGRMHGEGLKNLGG